MKRLAAVILAIIMVIGLASCGAAKPQTFSADGLDIGLSSDFSAENMNGFVKVFTSEKVTVFVMKEDKAGFGGKSMTFREYGELLRMANATRNPSEIKTEGNISYFEYDHINGSESYSYLTAFYEANTAFWTVQFACPQAEYSATKAQLLTWAVSVVLR